MACSQNKIDEVLELLFETATDTRKFEIDLFWKRSLFFWGFIAAAFAGYATVKESLFALILACFGLACSVIWTLGNRGSKYWQEAWEEKVERIEDALPRSELITAPMPRARTNLPILPMFATREPIDATKRRWLRGRLYSVSKLTIALSDYTSFLWFGLMIRSVLVVGHERHLWDAWVFLATSRKWTWLAFPILTALFLGLVVWQGRTTEDEVQKAIPAGSGPTP